MSSLPVPPAPLVERLRSARHIVVLSGAGMSAESGIPTFRDRGAGLWARFDPQELATPEAFRHDPETVWAWYEWRRHSVAWASPHAGHLALTALAARPQVESLTIVTKTLTTCTSAPAEKRFFTSMAACLRHAASTVDVHSAG